MSSGRDQLASLRQRYLAAQLAGNRREALRVVVGEGIALGLSVLDLQLHVIQEAQREIGRLWQENEINIAQEHMATAISHMALAQLYDEAPHAPSNHKKVVVACVEGELHDFPARLVADALDLSGFEVRYLGADVPLHSLLPLLASEASGFAGAVGDDGVQPACIAASGEACVRGSAGAADRGRRRGLHRRAGVGERAWRGWNRQRCQRAGGDRAASFESRFDGQRRAAYVMSEHELTASWDAHSRELILTCDASGTILARDARASRILRAEVGSNLQVLLVQGSEAKLQSLLAKAGAEVVDNYEVALVAFGKPATLSFCARPGENGAIELYVLVLPDGYGETVRNLSGAISEVLVLNREISRQKKQLASTNTQLTEAYQGAR